MQKGLNCVALRWLHEAAIIQAQPVIIGNKAPLDLSYFGLNFNESARTHSLAARRKE
jgi:hypothetical protein